MIITVAHHKGGVGKTTTAVHLAAFLQSQGPTLLLDGDDTRNATAWGEDGPGFSFRVAPAVHGPKLARQFEHVVIDTGQKPNEAEIRDLAESCDLMVVPAVPAELDNKGLVAMLKTLRRLGATNFKVLLVKYPPPPEPEGEQLREMLDVEGVPVFRAAIPRLKAFDKAAASGVTVREVADPRARRAWDAYAAVGEEILHGN